MKIVSDGEGEQRRLVGILGATGLVGQRLIALLEDHPWFRVGILGASSMSVGKKYGQFKWRVESPSEMPTRMMELEIVPCEVEFFKDCSWVFSALDSSVAKDLEPKFRDFGIPVFTNSAAYRMDPKVPLIVPTANGQELKPTLHKLNNGNPGFIVANSNCTTSGIAVVLKAFLNAGLVLHSVMIHSLQAVSGAGASPGLSVMDIQDNVIPYIPEEELKVEEELKRILGLENLRVSASCNRVMVMDGHTINLAIKFDSKLDGRELLKRSRRALLDYQSLIKNDHQLLLLPTMPTLPIYLFEEKVLDRPQPRFDRMRGGGMCTSVGRIRECKVLDIKMTILLHNTILGAAGSALLNAEIAFSQQLFK